MVNHVLGPCRRALFSRYRAVEAPIYSIGFASQRSILHGSQPEYQQPPGSNHQRARGLSSSSIYGQSPEKPNTQAQSSTASAAAPSVAEDLHPDWRRRRVVSSFLCHGPLQSADFQVSIFKRSKRVRTYPGKWAACSGSVEAMDVSPVRAALRELHEETGLSETDLVRVGGGGGPRNAWGEEMFSTGGVRFELHDANMCIVWEVWPFLWRVLGAHGKGELPIEETRAKIQLDWEHDEMRFASLEEIKTMDTVEDLGRGVRVVLASLQQK